MLACLFVLKRIANDCWQSSAPNFSGQKWTRGVRNCTTISKMPWPKRNCPNAPTMRQRIVSSSEQGNTWQMKEVQAKFKIPESVSKRWWWRRLIFLDFDETTHTTKHKFFVPEYPSYGFSGEWSIWNSQDELMAFRYELL